MKFDLNFEKALRHKPKEYTQPEWQRLLEKMNNSEVISNNYKDYIERIKNSCETEDEFLDRISTLKYDMKESFEDYIENLETFSLEALRKEDQTLYDILENLEREPSPIIKINKEDLYD